MFITSVWRVGISRNSWPCISLLRRSEFVEGANIIYSDDNDVRRLAVQSDIVVIRIAELPLPPEMAQGRLDFGVPADTGEAG